jgi:hypothetical protein
MPESTWSYPTAAEVPYLSVLPLNMNFLLQFVILLNEFFFFFFKKKKQHVFMCFKINVVATVWDFLLFWKFAEIKEMTGFTSSVDTFLSSKNIVLHPDFYVFTNYYFPKVLSA